MGGTQNTFHMGGDNVTQVVSGTEGAWTVPITYCQLASKAFPSNSSSVAAGRRVATEPLGGHSTAIVPWLCATRQIWFPS